jgi:hypothetical protein
VIEFELLDLDAVGGMFIRADHLFISETKVEDGLRRFAPEALLNGLLNRGAIAILCATHVLQAIKGAPNALANAKRKFLVAS